MLENINPSWVMEYWNNVQLSESYAWGAVAVSLFCLLLINYRKSRYLQKKVERLQHDLLVTNNGAIGMGQQLINLEKKLRASEINHKPVRTQAPSLQVVGSPVKHSQDNSGDIYDMSRELLYQGYDIEEVAQKSGLSYSEVSLLKAMAR